MKWFPFKLSRRSWFWTACASLALGMVGGFFFWEALGNPMPKSWYLKVGSATDGIWGPDGPFAKFEKWRWNRVSNRWIAHTENLDLAGTIWVDEAGNHRYISFGEDGVYRFYTNRFPDDKPTLWEKLDGTKYKFDGTKGYAAVEPNRSTRSGTNLFFGQSDIDIAMCMVGYNGNRLFIYVRVPKADWEIPLRQITQEELDEFLASVK